MKRTANGTVLPMILKNHSIKNIIVNDAGEMTSIQLDDGRALDGITNAGMMLDPTDHTQLHMRIAVHGPITINGKPAVEAFQAKLDSTPRVVTQETALAGPDGKLLA